MKLALIADIHANREAFRAILREIKRQNAEKIACLGDIVGYGPHPNECIELIKEHNIESVQGNHDLNAVTLERIKWFNHIAAKAVEWTNKKLTEENKKFLLALTKRKRIENVFIVHGSPQDPLYEYIFPDIEPIMLNEFFTTTQTNIIAMGHTHIPFIKEWKGKLILNPGSVGQPRDNNPDASFAIVDTKTCEAKIIRVTYDIEKTAESIRREGLPEMLAERIKEGR